MCGEMSSGESIPSQRVIACAPALVSASLRAIPALICSAANESSSLSCTAGLDGASGSQ